MELECTDCYHCDGILTTLHFNKARRVVMNDFILQYIKILIYESIGFKKLENSWNVGSIASNEEKLPPYKGKDGGILIAW